MNNIDKAYTDLLQDILDNGVEKKDRTGTGTISVFGRQIRHKMSDGFPLLTTKKMAWKQIVTELLWFLRGDTNIKYLVDNNCHIWDGDAFSNYIKDCILFDEINDSRITRTIIGCPSSTDITSFIDPESDWGGVDYLTGEKIKYEDCDNGVIYFNQKMVKISSLKQIGVIGLRCESLYRALNESNFVYSKEEFINKIKTDDEFANKWGELGPIYGKQWRKWESEIGGNLVRGIKGDWIKTDPMKIPTDQIANLINDLKTNPDSRRLMVNAWNVGEIDQMVLPPCHYGFQVYTRELSLDERYDLCAAQKSKLTAISEEDYIKYNIPTRAISLMWNQRSVDTFLGLPFNIASYGLLLEILAKEVNMVPDELIGNLGDVHLYSNHIEQAKEQISREPFELPEVRLRNYETMDELLETKDVTSVIQLWRYDSHPTIKAPLSN